MIVPKNSSLQRRQLNLLQSSIHSIRTLANSNNNGKILSNTLTKANNTRYNFRNRQYYNRCNSYSTLFNKKNDTNEETKNKILKSKPQNNNTILYNYPLLQPRQQQKRNLAISSYLPEFMQQYTIWGGSAILLKTLHMNGTIPYWACISISSITVRSLLFPLVVQSAHVSARFATVAPEVQFLITMYQQNNAKLKQEKANGRELRNNLKETLGALRNIYKFHKISPFAPFKVKLI